MTDIENITLVDHLKDRFI